MQITDVKQQIKRSDRYSIFVDGKYAFSLSEGGLVDSRLHIGQEVTKEELEKLKDTALLDKIYNKVLGLLARRQRSEWEIREYLKRNETPPLLTEEILNKLSELNYVDDKKFATMWVENRRLLKSTSLRRLKLELKQKRVPDEMIQEVLVDDETDEKQVLRELVEKKQKITRYQDKQKLMQYLIRQGFNYGDIKDVLKDN